MELTVTPLHSKYRTVQEIKYAVKNFHKDLKSFPEVMEMNLPEFFDMVRSIPYVKDIPEKELVSRPKYLLTMFPALDCKKKTILMASFMLLRYGPGSYRYVLSSNRPDGKIGHIFTQVYNGKQFINADATYSHNKLGAKKHLTNFEIVRG